MTKNAHLKIRLGVALLGLALLFFVYSVLMKPTPKPSATPQRTTMPGGKAAPISGGGKSLRRGSYLRLVNLAQSAPSLLFVVNGVRGATATPFGRTSSYVAMPTGIADVQAVTPEGRQVWGPQKVELNEGQSITVGAVGPAGASALRAYGTLNAGKLTDQPQISYLHAADSVPYVVAMLDSSRFRNGLPFGQQSEYYPVGKGKHTVEVDYDQVTSALPNLTPKAVEANASDNAVNANRATVRLERQRLLKVISMEPCKIYTVVIVNGRDGKPGITINTDSFTSTVAKPAPTGAAPHTSAPAVKDIVP